MIEKTNKSECSGCGACRDICPVKAISLYPDEEGFMYPQVDKGKCIGCGKCNKVCPVSNKAEKRDNGTDTIAYAAQTKEEEIRKNSSSGGVFTEIATYILEKGGVVFGAAFDENFKVIHIGVDSTEHLYKLRGSKYVQSEIGDTYRKALEYLDAGRLVLFTGTPCQIAGLYNFLNRDYDNLYTQDIICHGVPSPLVWQKYIEYRESKASAKLQSAFFRHKKYGWKRSSVKFEFSNGTEYIQDLTEDLYMRSYLRNLTLRPSCYSCAFKTKHRPSDFTLADFWGVENVLPEIADNKGTSLVILHSEKAHEVFEEIKSNLKYQAVDIDEAVKYNSAMLTSVPQNADRAKFFDSIRGKGFYGALKYIRAPLSQRIRKIIKTFIKKAARR